MEPAVVDGMTLREAAGRVAGFASELGCAAIFHAHTHTIPLRPRGGACHDAALRTAERAGCSRLRLTFLGLLG
ncbi:hypothetical protein GCM10010377_73500 [Streptomyces viridiviolaceus]|nr:hypothetical protein GCM10010377_73500 [Streptomyces viridiviolaceus]